MIKVYIQEPYSGPFWMKVFIIDRHKDIPDRILRYEEGYMKWDALEPESIEVAPTFTLPEDTGRALLEALMQHYQGSEDTRALRRDYDAERKRVDELVKTLGDVTKALAVEHV